VGGESSYSTETSVERSVYAGIQSWTHNVLSAVAENWTHSLAGRQSEAKAQQIDSQLEMEYILYLRFDIDSYFVVYILSPNF